MIEPIDAVITWVDGRDPEHVVKRSRFLDGMVNVKQDSVAPTRFNHCGEINYCVRSLLHFAPWIRTIYIVTDNQTPAILKELVGTEYENKVKIIDHKIVFSGYEDNLPTFNSVAIESVLWRIPNLADHFIYLNDDCFMIAPVKPHDFIRDGKVVLRGEWKLHTERKLQNRLKYIFSKNYVPEFNRHRIMQEKCAKLMGFQRKFFDLPHAPFLLQKPILKDFFNKCPSLFLKNLSYRVRDTQQLWSVSLATHIEIKNNNVVFENNLKTMTVNPECHSLDKIKSRFAKIGKNKNIAFLCVQSMDTASDSTQQWLSNWLDKKIPTVEAIYASEVHA